MSKQRKTQKPTKGKATESKERTSRARFSDSDAREVLAALKAGTTTLMEQKKARGFKSNAPMRGKLLALMGGDKKAYLTLVLPRKAKQEKPKATRAARKATRSTKTAASSTPKEG
jgi:Na+-transporting NADH:ubiquinone oxidoreductase subunit NqrA